MKILFSFHLGSNAGYAMTSLEKILYAAASQLTKNPLEDIHFSFTNLDKGMPQSLPADFKNVFAFNFKNTDPANLQAGADYCRKHAIEEVVLIDCEPIHPVVRMLKNAGVRSVLTYWGAPVSAISPLWKLLIKKIEVALSKSKVDGLIFESKAMVDSATKGRGFPASAVDYAYLGVDIEKYNPKHKKPVNTELGFREDQNLVIYSGHMEERKGVAIIIEAANELINKRKRKDVCFFICGNKPGEADHFMKRIDELGLGHSVKFGGYRSDLPVLFASSFAGVIASTGWDSFTYSSIEITASGIPLVVSKLQGLAEAALDGETGLHFEPGNAKMLADKLEFLLDHTEKARELGANGRKRAEKELSLKHHADSLAAIFRKRSVL